MSKKTSYLLGILATILIGSFFYYKMCCQNCDDDNLPSDVTVLSDKTNIEDYNIFNLSGNDLNYTCNDNFRFLTNGFNNIQPVSDSINIGIDLLKDYFVNNLNDKIIITGYALKTEKNSSAFPNLALARANDIKTYFVSKGIATNRFELKGEMRDSWKMAQDTILGPAEYRIIKVEVDSKATIDWNALKAKLNANPLILYFDTNQSDINLSSEERQKVADLVNYLDNVEGATLNAIGHTDNSGNRNVNVKLGLDRANFAKEYLSKNGVANNKIITSSKGPDEPIADNKTNEGKAKNRRTVVEIK